VSRRGVNWRKGGGGEEEWDLVRLSYDKVPSSASVFAASARQVSRPAYACFSTAALTLATASASASGRVRGWVQGHHKVRHD